MKCDHKYKIVETILTSSHNKYKKQFDLAASVNIYKVTVRRKECKECKQRLTTMELDATAFKKLTDKVYSNTECLGLKHRVKELEGKIESIQNIIGEKK
jgi:hypothetical protein